MAIVEPRPDRVPKVGLTSCESMLDRRPVRRVVDVPHAVDVRGPEGPRRPPAVARGRRQGELRRGDSALSRLRVRVESRSDSRRTRVRAEMNPRAVDLDRPAFITGQRPAPPGRERREAASPRDDGGGEVVEKRPHHIDPHRAKHPEMLRCAPSGLLDVVGRGILQIPGDGVETQPAGRIRVRQPDAVAGSKGPARGGLRDEGLHVTDPTPAPGPSFRPCLRARSRRTRAAGRAAWPGCPHRR